MLNMNGLNTCEGQKEENECIIDNRIGANTREVQAKLGVRRNHCVCRDLMDVDGFITSRKGTGNRTRTNRDKESSTACVSTVTSLGHRATDCCSEQWTTDGSSGGKCKNKEHDKGKGKGKNKDKGKGNGRTKGKNMHRGKGFRSFDHKATGEGAG